MVTKYSPDEHLFPPEKTACVSIDPDCTATLLVKLLTSIATGTCPSWLEKWHYHPTSKEGRLIWLWQLAKYHITVCTGQGIFQGTSKSYAGCCRPATSTTTSRLQAWQILYRSDLYLKADHWESDSELYRLPQGIRQYSPTSAVENPSAIWASNKDSTGNQKK